VRHLGILDEQTVQGFASPRLGITADADDGADAERLDHDAQELITLLVYGCHDLVGQFLGDDVTPLLGVLEEQQRAVVMDKMIRKEGLGLAEAFLEQTLKTATAHLGAMAREPSHLLPRVLLLRPTHWHLQSHPIPDSSNLAERYASLSHTEGAGVHA